MFKLFSFGALATLAVLALLPTDGRTSTGNISVARADSRLIQSLRDMAQAPEPADPRRATLTD
jgi:hypothetical protein